MRPEVLAPGVLLALDYLTRATLDEGLEKTVRKALVGSAILSSLVLELDPKFTLLYAALGALSSAESRVVYVALFGGILAGAAYLVANPLVALVPLALTSLASPLAHMLNRASWRSEKRFLWAGYMFALSTGISSYLLVSFGPLNPLWGLLVGAVATWAARVDDTFALPLYSFVATAMVYGPPSGLVAGFGFSLMASSFAYYLKALDFDGLVGGTVVGMLVYAASPALFGTMLTFMVSSTLIGRFARHDERFQKKGKRNAIQVLSNSFAAALAGLLILSGRDGLGLGIAAIAAAAADTWATELGSLSSRRPRLITTLQPVEKGKSGGVTPAGLMASLLAGAFIFLVTFPFYGTRFLLPALVGGALGSLLDSLLGASVQGIFRCRVCGRATEHREHCGKTTLPERGLWWFNNDLVNLVSTAGAMVIAL